MHMIFRIAFQSIENELRDSPVDRGGSYGSEGRIVVRACKAPGHDFSPALGDKCDRSSAWHFLYLFVDRSSSQHGLEARSSSRRCMGAVA